VTRALIAALAGVIAFATSPANATPPVEEDYLLSCAGCHRMDGRGVPGVVPSLEETRRLAGLAGGREYLARVPGVAQAPLSDARLARLLNWVIAEFGRAEDAGGPQPAAYTAAEIGPLRRDPLRDPAAARPH
jgi:mono/diheme cytochrome c family protein